MNIGVINEEEQQKAMLKGYNASRALSQKMILRRMSDKRNYTIPKARIRTDLLKAQDLQSIITKEHLMNYLNDVEDKLNVNTKLSNADKINMVNEQLFNWGQVKNKAIRDGIIGNAFIKDADERMKSITTSFLTGKLVAVQTTKNMQIQVDAQKDAINNEINKLNIAKEKTKEMVIINNINDVIRYLIKTLTTLDNTNTPLSDDIFTSIINKGKDILVGIDNEKRLMIQQQDKQKNDKEIDETFDKLYSQSDELYSEFNLMVSKYNSIKQQTSQIIPDVEKIIILVSTLNDEIKTLSKKKNSNDKNDNFIYLLRNIDNLVEKMGQIMGSQNQNKKPIQQSSPIVEEFEEEERKPQQEQEGETYTVSLKRKPFFGYNLDTIDGPQLVDILRKYGSEELKSQINKLKEPSKSLSTLATKMKYNILFNYTPTTELTTLAKNEVLQLMSQQGLGKIIGKKGGVKINTANHIESVFLGGPKTLPRGNNKTEKEVRHFETIQF